MAEFLFEFMSKTWDKDVIANCILEDVMKVGGRNVPPFLKKLIPQDHNVLQKEVSKANKRQQLRKED